MRTRKAISPIEAIAGLLALVFAAGVAGGAGGGQISPDNWGCVAAPVYGSSQVGLYAGAELFTGPNQFDGDYYHGVLPNGRIVRPAGTSVQVGMNPLGVRLTPDGRYLIVSNDDERETGLRSLQASAPNVGGYTLSVFDTRAGKIVSQVAMAGRYFIGLQATGEGPYTVWASGGGDNDIKLFKLSAEGTIRAGSPADIRIEPITPADAGFVTHYTLAPSFVNPSTGRKSAGGTGAQITFPAGMALSPDRRFLYVACIADDSLAVIDTSAFKVVRQVAVGYRPYDVAVSADGNWVFVSNWGITEYKFVKPSYDASGRLTGVAPAGANEPEGFYVPRTDTQGPNPKTSSVSILSTPGGDGARATLVRSVYEGKPLDENYQVGDTHPCAMALVPGNGAQYLYVAKANSDRIGIIRLAPDKGAAAGGIQSEAEADFDLSPVKVAGARPELHGAYPNAIAVSPDHARAYVAEAGINSVAVLDTSDPAAPTLIGRIPTGWYPTALEVSPDDRRLYVVNAKGIGEDVRPPNTAPSSKAPAPAAVPIDSNYIFGSLQTIDLTRIPANISVPANNFVVCDEVDSRVVPAGGSDGSKKIAHVFFILHENKTFDSMLGNLGSLGPYASTRYSDAAGAAFVNAQYTGVSLNTQMLAAKFAVAVNYYSDAEESDAGHQFSASGTATDYTEKTLLVKEGLGLLVSKNFEPEDYPEAGYVFNNAARHGVSFKDYGDMIRIAGNDTGTAAPTTRDDPDSGKAGYPSQAHPLVNAGDVQSPVQGLGQSYYLALPGLAVLGGKNADGEARLDRNYPGYNFNISDQRRALEFCKDFDRMVSKGTLPRFLYIYQPNDHTGAVQADNVAPPTPAEQVADGDVALGMVVEHIMRSAVYYDATTGQGSAIFVTYDDAQGTVDHIHPHRTPLIVISPYAKPAYPAKRHYSTASIVKTEELLLGLPPGNLGDLLATDLRDMFQPEYNGIAADQLSFSRTYSYWPSPEGRRIWSLVKNLNTSAPDLDSRRLGNLARLSMEADRLHDEAALRSELRSAAYKERQEQLYKLALAAVAGGPAPDDDDDD